MGIFQIQQFSKNHQNNLKTLSKKTPELKRIYFIKITIRNSREDSECLNDIQPRNSHD
jgi:hypothetical protein